MALKIVSIVLMVLGVLLSLFGILFKIMHWPGAFIGLVSGGVCLIIGLTGLIVYLTGKKK